MNCAGQTSEPFELAVPAALSILRAARAAHPAEACGLLLGPRPGLALTATLGPNLAADPRRAFELCPGHVAATQRCARNEGLLLLGCWHSHPMGEARPSAADLEGALLWPDWLWLIVAGHDIAGYRLARGAASARLQKVELAMDRPAKGAGATSLAAGTPGR